MQKRTISPVDFDGFPPPAIGNRRFVLFDAARVPNAVHLLDAYDLKYICLFSGKPAIELEDVAPYLIEITTPSPQAEEFIWSLLAEGHGLALDASTNLKSMRGHLKKFLHDERDDTEVYVKFYTAMNFHYIAETRRFLDPIFDQVAQILVSIGDTTDAFFLVTAEDS